jgi:hypothetical protein
MEDNALRHCWDSTTVDHTKLAQSLCDVGEPATRKMNINNYLIDQSGQDWQELVCGWAEILPPVFTIWLVNRFGDVILVMDDGSVHLLDIGVAASSGSPTVKTISLTRRIRMRVQTTGF